jgi:hypothetical protein
MAANQLILAPIVLTAIFTWNLTLQGQPEKIVGKMKRDMFPTMQNGDAPNTLQGCGSPWFKPHSLQVENTITCFYALLESPLSEGRRHAIPAILKTHMS